MPTTTPMPSVLAAGVQALLPVALIAATLTAPLATLAEPGDSQRSLDRAEAAECCGACCPSAAHACCDTPAAPPACLCIRPGATPPMPAERRVPPRVELRWIGEMAGRRVEPARGDASRETVAAARSPSLTPHLQAWLCCWLA